MENKEVYRKINEQRLVDKAAPKVQMMSVMENFINGVNFYNSYGLAKEKKPATTKKPLGENN